MYHTHACCHARIVSRGLGLGGADTMRRAPVLAWWCLVGAGLSAYLAAGPEDAFAEAQSLIAHGRYSDAITVLAPMYAMYPVDAVLLLYTRALSRSGDADAATGLLERALRDRPTRSVAVLWCEDQMNSILRRASRVDGGGAPVHDVVATFLSPDLRARLVDICDQALEQDPGSHQAQSIVGVLKMLLGDLDESRRLLTRILDEQPPEWENHAKIKGALTQVLRALYFARFFKASSQDSAFDIARQLIGIDASAAAMNLYHNALSYTKQFHPDATNTFLEQLQRSYGEQAGDGLPALVTWQDALRVGEVSIEPLPNPTAGGLVRVPELIVHPDGPGRRRSNSRAIQLQWGDWIPFAYEDKRHALVRFSVPVHAWGLTTTLRSERFVYLSIPWGFASGNYRPMPRTGPVLTIPHPCLVIAPNSQTNIYHHLVESVAILAVALRDVLPLHPDLHVMLPDRPFFRQLQAMLNLGPPVVWRDVDHPGRVLLERALYINFALGDGDSPPGADDGDGLDGMWARRDYFNKYRPSAASIRWARDLLLSSLPKSSRSSMCGPRLVYVSRTGTSRSLTTNQEMGLIDRMRQRVGGECVDVFRVAPGESAPSLVDHAAAFASADIIVGAHGAGLANLIWAPPGASLIYWPTNPMSDVNHIALAAALNVSVHVIEPMHAYIWDAFHLSDDEFEACARLVIGAIDRILRRTPHPSSCTCPAEHDDL